MFIQHFTRPANLRSGRVRTRLDTCTAIAEYGSSFVFIFYELLYSDELLRVPQTMLSNELIIDAFLSCRSYLARTLSRLLPPHDIEDIVQETYVRICQFKPKEEVRAPRALMAKIARNLALDHLKRADYRLSNRFDDASEMEIGETSRQRDETLNQAASDEEFAQFCGAVRQLPQQCRRVFVLKKVYGYSQREIAAELQISESTVEKHIAKGMKLCIHYMLNHADNNLDFMEPEWAISGREIRK